MALTLLALDSPGLPPFQVRLAPRLVTLRSASQGLGHLWRYATSGACIPLGTTSGFLTQACLKLGLPPMGLYHLGLLPACLLPGALSPSFATPGTLPARLDPVVFVQPRLDPKIKFAAICLSVMSYSRNCGPANYLFCHIVIREGLIRFS
jgi:hypothetical protein